MQGIVSVGRVPRRSLENYKAICCHSRQTHNTDKFMKCLEKGINIVEQLNRLGNKSVLDEDVQKGPAIIINHSQLPGKGAYKRPRKLLGASYQNP